MIKVAKELNQKILDILKVHSKFITSEELSEKLGVSRKTITRRINSLNNQFSKPIIISQRGRGYKLDYSNYLSSTHKKSVNDSTTQLRQENILSRLLFSSPKPVKMMDLVNSLYVSESVLQNDEKVIAKHLKRWDLRLERKQRSIRIIGEEKNIRSALIESVLHLNKATDIDSLRNSCGELNQADFNFALSQVEIAVQALNGSLPYPYNINFFAHIYILLNRARAFRSVNQAIATDDNIQKEIQQNPEIFDVCKLIILNISNYLHVDSNSLNSETYYLFEYLLTSRFNSFDGVVLNDSDLAEKVTNCYVETVSENLNQNFTDAIKTEIKNHILSMISRLKMHISLPNALLNDIELEYPEVFGATKKASEKVSKLFDLPKISDDETGFICLYFAKYYEETKDKKKYVRTYIICTTGIGTSGIISTKIAKAIPEIKVVGLLSSLNIEKIFENQSNIDLLISTVPIKGKIDIPVELVSAFFTKQDEEKVRAIVRKIQNGK